jgi:hypothetical protein
MQMPMPNHNLSDDEISKRGVPRVDRQESAASRPVTTATELSVSMKSLSRIVTLALAAALSASALACGVCIEDKIAATYDHAVVLRAVARHQVMVFGEIEGAADMKAATDAIVRTAPQVRGIDRKSVRISVSPAAFSFALAPATQAPDAAVAELQKRLRIEGVKLSVLRVMRGDAKTARN